MNLSSLLHKGFKPDKCNVALKMATARIKLLRNTKHAQLRQMRREIARLLDGDHDEIARTMVENVIREEKFMQALDFIELYCKLLVERMSTIDSQKTCPTDLKEAIATLIFASIRCSDILELTDVRKNFTSKYGKEFATSALEVRSNSGVNHLVVQKLSVGALDVHTKLKTLCSIAAEHKLKWEPKAFEETLPTGLYYESSEIPANRKPPGAANSSGSKQEIRANYFSAEIHDSSNPPHENTVPASGSNWNVEFKDAASAAWVAADSANMASIAARAAAQLASRDGSEQELEPRGQTKCSKEQHRTRGVTSDTKRVGQVRTRAEYADETESITKERENPAEAFSSTEQRREEPPVPGHIHPNLPKDYESFVAYFKSLAH